MLDVLGHAEGADGGQALRASEPWPEALIHLSFTAAKPATGRAAGFFLPLILFSCDTPRTFVDRAIGGGNRQNTVARACGAVPGGDKSDPFRIGAQIVFIAS
jgi:hypothetical protein